MRAHTHTRRQLLHEDKEARQNPPALEMPANLSSTQVRERAELAMAAYGRERRRNTELVGGWWVGGCALVAKIRQKYWPQC